MSPLHGNDHAIKQKFELMSQVKRRTIVCTPFLHSRLAPLGMRLEPKCCRTAAAAAAAALFGPERAVIR